MTVNNTILFKEIDSFHKRLRRYLISILYIVLIAIIVFSAIALIGNLITDFYSRIIIVIIIPLSLISFPIMKMTEILPNTPIIIYEEGITMPLSWIDKNILKKRTYIRFSDIKTWAIRKARYLSTIESIIQIETADGIAYSTGTYKEKEVIEKSYEILSIKIGDKMRSSV